MLSKQEEYLALFTHNQFTGALLHKIAKGSRAKAGAVIKCIGSHGYIVTNHNKKTTPIHSIIWVMHNGDIPEGYYIDHIDCNKLNNRIDNLRLVTKKQNTYNRKSGKPTKKLPVGVTESRGRFIALITKDSKRTYIGSYKTVGEARASYLKKASEMFGEFAHKSGYERIVLGL